ncbi:MAG: sigma-70 family RNA polymerase sigma factor [Planctomycetales bacterium]|nr:sigma-70 family RNA polymerase sigma factor [Planctomycetales bacterium]
MSQHLTGSSACNDSDRQLASAKAGSDEALAQLLADARDFLMPVAARGIDSDVRGQLSASDIVQETLLEAHRKFREFRGDATAQFRAWLRRILITRLINHYRRLRGTLKRSVDNVTNNVDIEALSARNAETPSHVAMRNEESLILDEAIATLTAAHREIILLRHRDQLSFNDIAIRLGKSADAVRMLWYRALSDLSREVQLRSRE